MAPVQGKLILRKVDTDAHNGHGLLLFGELLRFGNHIVALLPFPPYRGSLVTKTSLLFIRHLRADRRQAADRALTNHISPGKNYDSSTHLLHTGRRPG
jgi:hypothetical protein